LQTIEHQKSHLPTLVQDKVLSPCKTLNHLYFEEFKNKVLSSINDYPLNSIGNHSFFSLSSNISDIFQAKNIKNIVSQINQQICVDVAKIKLQQSQKAHNAGINGLGLLKEGSMMVSGSSDKSLILWEMPSMKSIKTIPTVNGIKMLACHKTDAIVFTANEDHSLGIWDLGENSGGNTAPAHLSDIVGLQYIPERKFLVSCSFDKCIKIWDASKKKELFYLGVINEAHTKAINCLISFNDG